MKLGRLIWRRPDYTADIVLIGSGSLHITPFRLEEVDRKVT
jgi:hypothetical protein